MDGDLSHTRTKYGTADSDDIPNIQVLFYDLVVDAILLIRLLEIIASQIYLDMPARVLDRGKGSLPHDPQRGYSSGERTGNGFRIVLVGIVPFVAVRFENVSGI